MQRVARLQFAGGVRRRRRKGGARQDRLGLRETIDLDVPVLGAAHEIDLVVVALHGDVFDRLHDRVETLLRSGPSLFLLRNLVGFSAEVALSSTMAASNSAIAFLVSSMN